MLSLISYQVKGQQPLHPESRRPAALVCGIGSAVTYAVTYSLIEQRYPKQAKWIGAGAGMIANTALTALVYTLSKGDALNRRQDATAGFCTGVVTVCIIRIGL